MSTIEAGLRYAQTHEWARLESDGTVSVGITDHAQEALAIQDVLHSRALTNTGNWKDPKVAHQRAKSISAMVKNDVAERPEHLYV